VKIEKKLIAYSAIVVLIGIASIMPSIFLMTAKEPPYLDDQPQFNIDVSYVYVGDYWNNDSVTASQSYGWAFSLAFQTSPNFDFKTTPFDAVIEYYAAEISSENGVVGNGTFRSGVIIANHSRVLNSNFSLFSSNQLFFSNSYRYSGGFGGYGNGTAQGFINGFAKDMNRTLGKPETLVVIVRRLGWEVFSENSTIAHLADSDVILQIPLRKYGDGFIYNNLFTEEELSRINPAMPQYPAKK